MKTHCLIAALTALFFAGAAHAAAPIYTYTLPQSGTTASYDEAIAVATLEGVINRSSPELFVLSRTNSRPQYWLDLLSRDHRWLQGRKLKPISSLSELVKFAGHRLKGAVIWDPAVPATINVATTCAGVREAIVLSPELAERYLPQWHLPIVLDFRGKFDGHDTGSAKNDAYRWAIREYLTQGLCSAHRLCLFEDSFATRPHDDEGYAVTRDWAVKNRAFVFDLSPWGDEKPEDDPNQRSGLDLETYKMILAETARQAAGKEMTELTGFFAQTKYCANSRHASAHLGVPTEWESVWLMSADNVYQNTISSDCFNQSFHSQAPRHPLTQRSTLKPATLEKKSYICVLMSDYDSATPLYDFLPKYWNDPNRGKIPLAWGINPSQLETYPDLIACYYDTATAADTFTADACCAGYINPNRIPKDSLPLFIRHNQKFFREADMSIAPMVLDQHQPSADVKDAFQQFAPDGYATIVNTVLGGRADYPPPQVWKGMPIIELLNDTCNTKQPAEMAGIMGNVIVSRGPARPGFYFFRTDWVSPSTILEAMNLLRSQHQDLNCEILGPREFFAFYKQSLERH